MQYKWLNCQGNKSIIVFFNGWGMDEKIVKHLDCENYDVLVLFDWRNFDLPSFDFTKYQNKILTAWSMGVFVCNYFYEQFKNFNSFIAVNGTQDPIDDNFGIPQTAYNLTIEHFNENTCSKFMKKISPDIELKNFCSRSLDELKQELIAIKNLKIDKYLNFNKAIISVKDRIFPYKNMKNFWSQKDIIISEIDSSHYVFDTYKKWSDLL